MHHHPLQVGRFVAYPPKGEVGFGGEASHTQTSDTGTSVKEGSSTPPEEIHHQPRDVEHMALQLVMERDWENLEKKLSQEDEKVGESSRRTQRQKMSKQTLNPDKLARVVAENGERSRKYKKGEKTERCSRKERSVPEVNTTKSHPNRMEGLVVTGQG
jgi:hypothetical protein